MHETGSDRKGRRRKCQRSTEREMRARQVDRMQRLIRRVARVREWDHILE